MAKKRGRCKSLWYWLKQSYSTSQLTFQWWQMEKNVLLVKINQSFLWLQLKASIRMHSLILSSPVTSLAAVFLKLLVTANPLQKNLQIAPCNPVRQGLSLVPFKERGCHLVKATLRCGQYIDPSGLGSLLYPPSTRTSKIQKFSNQPEDPWGPWEKSPCPPRGPPLDIFTFSEFLTLF